MKRTLVAVILCFLLKLSCFADEGMWLPIFLKQLNEKEMRAAGMKLKAEDIYSVNKGSLKDAIVQFGGGCTATVVSAKGLLFTNHHCGFGQIQSHSTLEHNYIKDGFWAKNMSEELPCAGLTVTFISRIEDVTKSVMAGITDEMDEKERQSKIDKNIDQTLKSINRQSYEEVSIKPFFAGNQYFAFVSITYKDVRMVGAPPESLGKYGADTDNWVWPRHQADFSVFRIYADANNLPAEYSPNNKPFTPKHFLPVSLDGIKENDFTLVMGFPGTTNEYLPGIAVKQMTEVINPIRISLRTKALNIMDAKMRVNATTKIQYAAKYNNSIANGWKKWSGESLGVKKYKGLERKSKYEIEFTNRLNTDPALKAKYGNLLTDFQTKYTEFERYAVAREATAEVFGRILDVTRIGNQVLQLIKVYETQGEAEYMKIAKKVKDGLPGFYKNFDADIDKEMFAELMMIYKSSVETGLQPTTITKMEKSQFSSLYQSSNLINEVKMNTLTNLPAADAVKIMKEDLLVILLKEVNEFNQNTISPKANLYSSEISTLQRKYMQAQMDVFKEKKFYPDANSTLRVSYGKVKPYSPKDALHYGFQTNIEGVIEKYVPGDYEFDLSPRFLELYQKRDFGRYSSNGTLPVCFIGANHTTGGNSGSPAMDAKGNLIGINFDRVWEGTMSDVNYDASICRNIMVDIRYVLWVIDKYAEAGYLLDEMKIIQKNKH
jgi:hypothetical protein